MSACICATLCMDRFGDRVDQYSTNECPCSYYCHKMQQRRLMSRETMRSLRDSSRQRPGRLSPTLQALFNTIRRWCFSSNHTNKLYSIYSSTELHNGSPKAPSPQAPKVLMSPIMVIRTHRRLPITSSIMKRIQPVHPQGECTTPCVTFEIAFQLPLKLLRLSLPALCRQAFLLNCCYAALLILCTALGAAFRASNVLSVVCSLTSLRPSDTRW